MCYKDEDQARAKYKLEEKIKDMPKFIKDYFKTLSSNKSKLTYWSTIRLFFEWLIDKKIINKPLEGIMPEDLVIVTHFDLVDYLEGIKASPDTIITKMNLIRSFWSYLIDNGYSQKNIVTKKVIQKFKVEKMDKDIELPTDEQLQSVLNNLESIKSEIISIRNISIAKLFIGTAMRLSELVGLDIDDLHFEREIPEITIWAKGKKRSRDVVVSQSAIDAINDYLIIRNSYPELKHLKPLFLSEHKDDDGNNKRISVSTVEKFFDKYSNGQIHPHKLRDYAATKMYESNHDIVGVSEQLGHSDINITRKRYVKANKNNMFTALNSF